MTHPALLKILEKYDLTNSNSSYDALVNGEVKIGSMKAVMLILFRCLICS